MSGLNAWRVPTDLVKVRPISHTPFCTGGRRRMLHLFEEDHFLDIQPLGPKTSIAAR